MKLSPTLTLALALAAGVAGAAIAQTTPTAGAPGSPPGASYSSGQTQALPSGQPQSAAGAMVTSPTAQPNAGMQATGQNAMMPPAASQSVAGANPEVQRAQEELRAAGLYKGAADGIMDPDTRAAIANFQDQHGLRRTEALDSQTLAALSANQTTGYGSSAPPASGVARRGGGTQSMTTAPMGPAGAAAPRHY